MCFPKEMCRKVLVRVEALGFACLQVLQQSSFRHLLSALTAAGKHGNADLPILIDKDIDPLFAAERGQ